MEDSIMPVTKQASKQKRRKEVVPALEVVTVSLSLAAGTSAAAAANTRRQVVSPTASAPLTPRPKCDHRRCRRIARVYSGLRSLKLRRVLIKSRLVTAI